MIGFRGGPGGRERHFDDLKYDLRFCTPSNPKIRARVRYITNINIRSIKTVAAGLVCWVAFLVVNDLMGGIYVRSCKYPIYVPFLVYFVSKKKGGNSWGISGLMHRSANQCVCIFVFSDIIAYMETQEKFRNRPLV